MQDIQITQNFKLSEFLKTNTRLPNSPSQEHTNNIAYMCSTFLEPLRQSLGKKIIITSGFRSREVNKYVGGSSTSAHLEGLAVDITSDMPASSLFITCVKFFDNYLPAVDQIIEYSGWVHLGFKPIGKAGRMDYTAVSPAGRAFLNTKKNAN